MKLAITQFAFSGDSVRAFNADSGETLFVANDVATALGYAQPKDAVAAHCKGAVKRRLPTAGGAQQVLCIPERDVYRLVMRSRLPAAEAFEEWVVGEVLPAIRKTGQYQADWRKLRHEAASTYKVMGAILQMTRADDGKPTAPHHFSNEARLVNFTVSGEFKSLDRDALSAADLALLAHLEERNAVLIGRGIAYDQRKTMLTQYAMDWRVARALPELQQKEVA